MTRSELKLVKSIGRLISRHPLKDWNSVARMAGFNGSAASIRSAIKKIKEIEEEERLRSLLEAHPDSAAVERKKKGKGASLPLNKEVIFASLIPPKRSISGDEFAKWLRIISPERPSEKQRERKAAPGAERMRSRK